MTFFQIAIDIVTYITIGSVAGLLAGILGLGGGMVVVPGLFFIFTHNPLIPNSSAMHLATGTSLASMVFTSAAAARAHHNQAYIMWFLYRRLFFGLIVGAFLGVSVSVFLSSEYLQTLFGIFLLIIATKFYLEMEFEQKIPINKPWLDRFMSLCIGIISGLLGVGGGSLMIPYLMYRGTPIRKAAPIAALSSLTVAVAGSVCMMVAGSVYGHLPPYSTGYIYWPAVLLVVLPALLLAPIGVKMSYRLRSKHLKVIFIFIVIVMALAMLL